MIITVGGIKGGSGKTTIATHLAILRATAGKDVVLVDADDQETASDFTLLRNERSQGEAGYSCIKLNGPAVRTEVLRIKSKYDDVIIDTGGRDTTSQRAALTASDLLLVPFVPRTFDIWTVEKVVNLVEELRPANPNLTILIFLNRADPRGVDNQEAIDLLSEYTALSLIPTSLGTRKAFGNAASQGLAVTELKPHDEKAINEVKALYQYVFGIS
jgi:chromosome partitioning protein